MVCLHEKRAAKSLMRTMWQVTDRIHLCTYTHTCTYVRFVCLWIHISICSYMQVYLGLSHSCFGASAQIGRRPLVFRSPRSLTYVVVSPI